MARPEATLLAYQAQSPEEREEHHLKRAELREKIYKLKLRGKSMPEIEQELLREGLDVSIKMIGILLKEHLKFLASHDPDIKEARKLEADRYESLIASLWDRAHSGDLEAVNVLGSLIKSKSKLMGYEAAAKLSVKITPVMPTSATQEELERKQRDLFERLQAAGRIPPQLSFDAWIVNPRAYGSASANLALPEEVARSRPQDFIDVPYTSEK